MEFPTRINPLCEFDPVPLETREGEETVRSIELFLAQSAVKWASQEVSATTTPTHPQEKSSPSWVAVAEGIGTMVSKTALGVLFSCRGLRF